MLYFFRSAIICSFYFFSATVFAKEPLKIITSFYPLAFVLEEIAPDSILENLTEKNSHKFSPTPKNIIAINNADLFVYFSNDLEIWAPEITAQRKKTSISIQKKLPHLFFQLKKNNQKQHTKHKYLPTTVDPHLWLDPFAMSKIANLLGKELAKLNKKKAKNYYQKAQKLEKEFFQIHQLYQNSLKNCKQKGLIVTHDFLGYLARRYKFQTYTITGINTLDKPSGKRILELKKLSKKNISFLLVEKKNPTKFADILLQETSLTSLSIDTLTWKNSNYFLRMKNNLQTIQTALGC